MAQARSSVVTVLIDGHEYGGSASSGFKSGITQYSYDSDVLQLGDPCSVVLPNPKGLLNGKIKMGQTLELYIADPDVQGGTSIRKLKGVVISRQGSSSESQGTTVNVGGADLGWHLANNAAPLWFRLRGIRFSKLLQKVLDPSWDFAGVRSENDTNRHLKLGRAGAIQSTQGVFDQLIPPIQIEVGEMIADVLILYAKRERKLVNVSADGYLQIWAPAKNAAPLYTFHHHRMDEASRSENNVTKASLSESIDGLFTDVICVGTVLIPPEMVDATNPNEGHFRGTYRDASQLPFVRRYTFSDGDQLTKQQADARARWKAERGRFDSLQYVAEVKGHSQGGVFFEPDTTATVHDSVVGVDGIMYVSTVRYAGDERTGTTTTLTMRSPNLLGA